MRVWRAEVNEPLALHINPIAFSGHEAIVAPVEGIAAPPALGHAEDKGAIAKTRRHDIARLGADAPMAARGAPDLAVGIGQAHTQTQALLPVFVQPSTIYLGF